MRNVSFIHLPLLLSAAPAFAAENSIGEVALGDSFPDYTNIFKETGFHPFEQLVNVNKFLIEVIDFGLDQFFGQGAGDFGISLVIYTLFIKILIFPSYEK